MEAVCAFIFLWVVDENLNTPNNSSMADGAIIQGGIGRSGSLFYIIISGTHASANM